MNLGLVRYSMGRGVVKCFMGESNALPHTPTQNNARFGPKCSKIGRGGRIDFDKNINDRIMCFDGVSVLLVFEVEQPSISKLLDSAL